MPEYRWNQSELAAAYDAAAEHVHPHYFEMQEAILGLLPFPTDAEFLLVDAGGGSGRLVEKFLQRFPRARAVIIDQSEAFLDLSRRRLAPFGPRAGCRLQRLQEDWTTVLPEPPWAIVSMSAIHHLDPAEKQTLYRRCHDALAPGGVLLNGDEVRPADDGAYLAECRTWVAHMHKVIDAGLVAPPMREALLKWEARNVGHFGTPRTSGDDCHETIAAQLNCFLACGFAAPDAPWHKQLWAILRGVKK